MMFQVSREAMALRGSQATVASMETPHGKYFVTLLRAEPVPFFSLIFSSSVCALQVLLMFCQKVFQRNVSCSPHALCYAKKSAIAFFFFFHHCPWLWNGYFLSSIPWQGHHLWHHHRKCDEERDDDTWARIIYATIFGTKVNLWRQLAITWLCVWRRRCNGH